MPRTQIASLQGVEPETGEAIWIGVHAGRNAVGLVMSLERHGDSHLYMLPETCQNIVALLKAASERPCSHGGRTRRVAFADLVEGYSGWLSVRGEGLLTEIRMGHCRAEEFRTKLLPESLPRIVDALQRASDFAARPQPDPLAFLEGGLRPVDWVQVDEPAWQETVAETAIERFGEAGLAIYLVEVWRTDLKAPRVLHYLPMDLPNPGDWAAGARSAAEGATKWLSRLTLPRNVVISLCWRSLDEKLRWQCEPL